MYTLDRHGWSSSVYQTQNLFAFFSDLSLLDIKILMKINSLSYLDVEKYIRIIQLFICVLNWKEMFIHLFSHSFIHSFIQEDAQLTRQSSSLPTQRFGHSRSNYFRLRVIHFYTVCSCSVTAHRGIVCLPCCKMTFMDPPHQSAQCLLWLSISLLYSALCSSVIMIWRLPSCG